MHWFLLVTIYTGQAASVAQTIPVPVASGEVCAALIKNIKHDSNSDYKCILIKDR